MGEVAFTVKTVLLACDVYNHETPNLCQEWESEETITYMESTISALGYDVVVLTDPTEIVSALSGIPKEKRQDWMVWNLIEGYLSPSREAYIPALCEYLGFPHTGSAASVQTLTLDKFKTKCFLERFGVPMVSSQLVWNGTDNPKLSYPLFVKPNGEGSSLGISDINVIFSNKEWEERIPLFLREHRPLLVEPFLSGRELTVGVMGNFDSYEVLPAAYVNYPSGVYHEGIKSKLAFLESLDFQVEGSLQKELAEWALVIAKALEVSGYIRMDFKLQEGKPYFLEVNATPGFSHLYSTLPLLWEHSGKTYSSLLQHCIELGFEEYATKKRFQYGKDQLK